jgi:hypothetical protein
MKLIVKAGIAAALIAGAGMVQSTSAWQPAARPHRRRRRRSLVRA